MSDKSEPDEYNGCVDLDLWEDLQKRNLGNVSIGPVTPGQVLTSDAASMSYVNSNVNPLFDLDVDGHTRVKGDLVIEDSDGEVINVGEFMKTISERLCVLQPNLEAHEHYPALKDAYEKYKMLEKLLGDTNAKKD